MTVRDRVGLVKSKQLCFNCLGNHKVINCSNKFSCGICKKNHHVTLHFPREQKINIVAQVVSHENKNIPSNLDASAPSFEPLQANTSIDKNLLSATCNLANELKAVLLSTFVCLIKDASGNFFKVRGLLDVDANSNFMSKRLAVTAKCASIEGRKEKTNISVSGINNLSLNIKSKVSATILKRDKSFDLSLNFLVVPKITEYTPSRPLEINVSSLDNINLADDNFFEPGPIEFLIGAEHFYELLKPRQISLQDSNLRLQNSVFGYVVSGTLPAKGESILHCGVITDNLELERAVREFWEIENIERESEISKSKEVEICEQLFLRNYYRTETGKYYSDFLHEYSELGHITEVKDEDEQKGKYYIPHLGIYRPEKSSTPLSVVFNASTAMSKADLRRMYRMISIHPTQRQLQKILWKESINGPVKTFELNTVTYVTVSALLLAMRTLRQLAIDEFTNFPLAAAVLQSDSSIVMAFLKKEPCCMKMFVANRVAVVQEITEVRQWHHLPSKQNPSDLISRGADPVKLQLCELWWCVVPYFFFNL
ncbi:uncharacterized protein LOC118205320 [Stegodyphus dumicola]|uniref:uncharacterized protein LOC118205320 n=1 Tax=Stegodyphus dumicola TaxID=202533 RepID=UPI0015A7FD4B|nr:uncharacterized protein LOC118205320 [Stegodyphus dumicola]